MTRDARRLVVLRGAPADTAARAAHLVAGLEPGVVLQVSGAGSVASLLGGAFDVVVLDAHGGLDADRLGQAHGFVRGGGALVLRMDPPGGDDRAQRERLVVFPYTIDDVGRRFGARLERVLAGTPHETGEGPPLAPARRVFAGTPEQAAVVAALGRALRGPPGTATALVADRGRGKSSAIGLALRDAPPELRVAVSAESPEAVAEVLAHAGGRLAFTPLSALLAAPAGGEDGAWHVIVIDEAARVPVPVLRRLEHVHADARLVLATTVLGYEGTGRGFALRFLPWLAARRPLVTHTLAAPIRWAAGCPLEAFVFQALALDAEPPSVAELGAGGDETVEVVDRDRLATEGGERDLHDLFGLLVQAHYRTTPGDLARLLDAPNVAVHALRRGGRVVAATLVAEEGGWPEALTADVLSGRVRIRAHALADALVAHMGHPEAGAMRMLRSVRITTHPELRRGGLARRLVEHVHSTIGPGVDLIGTLFGATPELIAFRRRLGYEIVRVSASRGARTGEPSVLMLRAVSARASALVATLRRELAREMPLQLALMQADGELLLDPELAAALAADLPAPAPLDEAETLALVRGYAYGARTIESVASALVGFVTRHAGAVARLPLYDRRLVEGRVLERRSWGALVRETGAPSHAAAMRALRRAVRALLADDDIHPDPRARAVDVE
ncbi:MAG: tRNA(Met) cytidine acetyltransferase [Deltaproteobacteria bacterium]|nr:tRNA(Met) cytidine acetyltransferase [Deltaproteobacteria bacterium]